MVSLTKIITACSLLGCSVNALSIVSSLRPYLSQALDSWGSESSDSKLNPEIILTFPGEDDKPVPGDSGIVQCQILEDQILSLESVEIAPNPPIRGENLTFVAKGTLSKDIVDGAYAEVDVRYGFIKLLHETYDVCEEITKVDLECPIESGKQVITKTVEIPYEVPPGHYVVNVKAYTKDDELITCLTATVDFPPN
ncbi:Piso0_004502 [Millerozyma farinosa CBS 7064]|uniref:Phosphatidylglycerol/phosphatidylinositol transfer protein n=1 Tax=Pichia sorbitophila (strain ATCC MYA-4447 / BCRC 22081 / CBS 7064 / NBRC 10061 / NRRL Y-12695) TaxID=559304 RepID=G8Y5M5_PICSO|nr:Piso0_004502 [Millerozyma farinosa CBS 7064]CCE84936.1 Piso0_004502 [Millerozyma farinosa CBS 7064]